MVLGACTASLGLWVQTVNFIYSSIGSSRAAWTRGDSGLRKNEEIGREREEWMDRRKDVCGVPVWVLLIRVLLQLCREVGRRERAQGAECGVKGRVWRETQRVEEMLVRVRPQHGAGLRGDRVEGLVTGSARAEQRECLWQIQDTICAIVPGDCSLPMIETGTLELASGSLPLSLSDPGVHS